MAQNQSRLHTLSHSEREIDTLNWFENMFGNIKRENIQSELGNGKI